LPAASSGPPEEKPERVAPGRRERRTPLCSALLPMGFTEPSRSPGLLVSSYLTVSPLPPTNADGGLFSVALSLAFRPVGVTHHRTLWSPDFPPVILESARNVLCKENRRSPGPLRSSEPYSTTSNNWPLASGRWRPPEKRLFERDTCWHRMVVGGGRPAQDRQIGLNSAAP
jgi:hypothetical protein